MAVGGDAPRIMRVRNLAVRCNGWVNAGVVKTRRQVTLGARACVRVRVCAVPLRDGAG